MAKRKKTTQRSYNVTAEWRIRRTWNVKADSADQAKHLFLGLFPEQDKRVKELEPDYVEPIDGTNLEEALFIEESK